MSQRTRLKIGDFARLGQTSVITLRHYAALGLLTPSAVDPGTGYRYYTLDQLPRLQRIVALKAFHFSLAQIAILLDDAVSPARRHALLAAQHAQTQRRIAAGHARLAQLAAVMQQFEHEGTIAAYAVQCKQVKAQPVAVLRERIPMISVWHQLAARLINQLDDQRIVRYEPPMLLIHAPHAVNDHEMSIDVEVAQPVDAAAHPVHIPVRTLPGGVMACTRHYGRALGIGQAYRALSAWMATTAYHGAGPPRHVYLLPVSSSPTTPVAVEIQVPVHTAGAYTHHSG